MRVLKKEREPNEKTTQIEKFFEPITFAQGR